MKTFYKYIINLIWLIIVAALVFAFFQVNEIDNAGLIWPYSKVKSLELKECLGKHLDINESTINCSLSLKVGEYAKTPEQRLKFKEQNGIDLDRKSSGNLLGANWKKSWEELKKEENKNNQNSSSNNDNSSNNSIKSEGPLSRLKPTQESKNSILEKLNNLNVVNAYDDVNYRRTEWPHWKSIKGCWNTREEALKNQSLTKTLYDKDKSETTDEGSACSIDGTWEDPYSDEKIDKISKADLDHTVPLKAAARAGGQNWDRKQKEEFANDLDHLVITSATQNRTKGAKTPSEWMPPKESSHCDYAKIYTYTLDKYKLNITQADKDVLANAISSCPA